MFSPRRVSTRFVLDVWTQRRHHLAVISLMKATSHLLALRTPSQNGWKFSPSLWTCTWEQGALFALHSISDSLVPYFTVFFCSALLFSGPDSLQVRQTSPWVLASSIISSLAFIFTPILKQGPLSYVTPWSPVAHVPEEWPECLLPLFLTPFFIVKFVCSWNLHTCSRKHCRQFNSPNHQNKFSFMEIRQYLLSMATLLLSGTFPTLCWGEKEHELGCEMEDSPSSSSLMVTVVTWAGLFFKPLFSQLEKGR